MGYDVLDPNEWNRKDHYYFFKTFEEPFTGVVVDINVDKAYAYCKEQKISFFQYYLHQSIQAVNEIKALRLRIIDDELRLYKEVHASATMMRDDKTFGFSYIPYHKDFGIFSDNVKTEMARIKNNPGLFPPDMPDGAVVHYSAMPWIQFKGLTHARSYSSGDTSPKISFGKVTKDWKGDHQMPVSIHVHHALADGLDMANHLEVFKTLLDGKEPGVR